eukprot:868515-Rhodomonas_salina.3
MSGLSSYGFIKGLAKVSPPSHMRYAAAMRCPVLAEIVCRAPLCSVSGTVWRHAAPGDGV